MSKGGLLFTKVGSSAVFTESGKRICVTVLSFQGGVIIAHRTREKNNYLAMCIGYGKSKKNNKPLEGFYKKNSLTSMKDIVELRVSSEKYLLPVGSEIGIDAFSVGQFVDVKGRSLGKGFAGVMKRYGFGGQPGSHGSSLSHRSAGSTGGCQDPGRVFKGKKMAGRMGAEFVTVGGLKVEFLDKEKGLLAVRGAVPGYKGSKVLVSNSVKRGRVGFFEDLIVEG